MCPGHLTVAVPVYLLLNGPQAPTCSSGKWGEGRGGAVRLRQSSGCSGSTLAQKHPDSVHGRLRTVCGPGPLPKPGCGEDVPGMAPGEGLVQVSAQTLSQLHHSALCQGPLDTCGSSRVCASTRAEGGDFQAGKTKLDHPSAGASGRVMRQSGRGYKDVPAGLPGNTRHRAGASGEGPLPPETQDRPPCRCATCPAARQVLVLAQGQ